MARMASELAERRPTPSDAAAMSADRTVLVLPDRKRPIKTHALHCSYVKGHERLHGPKYVQMQVKDVPPNAGRCSHCGGGR